MTHHAGGGGPTAIVHGEGGGRSLAGGCGGIPRAESGKDRPARGPVPLLGAWLLAIACAAIAPGVASGGTVDCFADRVVSFTSGFADPNTGFRFAELPGIVLGPPGDSFPTQGSTTTVSLGHGGSITVSFTDNVIVDRPGPDFIVFENAFFVSSVPATPTSTCNVFAEPGKVEVSANGVTWLAFPYNAAALASVGSQQTPCSAIPLLHGLAGITPTFTGNWTVPDDPNVWDPNGTGGVSGAGGDAFDLATVGLAQARFVRITDLNLGTGIAGNAEGFDLDAVVALHSLPFGQPGPDADGDGLPDADESILYASDPFRADTDGDGDDDGAEAASCRSPLTASIAPSFLYDADLFFPEGTTSALRWNILSATATYDLIRGAIGSVSRSSNPLDLGPVTCVEDNSFNLSSADHPDTAVPPAGTAFFYLLRPKNGDYGVTSNGRARSPGAGDCVP